MRVASAKQLYLSTLSRQLLMPRNCFVWPEREREGGGKESTVEQMIPTLVPNEKINSARGWKSGYYYMVCVHLHHKI